MPISGDPAKTASYRLSAGTHGLSAGTHALSAGTFALARIAEPLKPRTFPLRYASSVCALWARPSAPPLEKSERGERGKKKGAGSSTPPLFFFPFLGLRAAPAWCLARATGWLVAYDGSRTPVPLGTPVTRCQARQGHRHAAGHGHAARIARRMNQTRTAYRARFTAELAELELLIAIVAARVKARRSGTATPASSCCPSCGQQHDAGCPSPRSCAPSPPLIGSLD